MNNLELIKETIITDLELNNVKFNKEKIFFNHTTLRLSWYGNKVLIPHYTHHEFQCNVSRLPSKVFEGFKKFTMPYYIGDRSVTVYSDYDAFGIRIYDTFEDYLNALINY